MRFQPSWVMESLFNSPISSIFFPISVRAQQLLWFKQRDIRLYVNDPVESRAMLSRALVQNQEVIFSLENRKKFNRTIEQPLDIAMNPFKNWLEKPFSRTQLDYMFYWREAAYEISDIMQRELFWAAVYSIIAYWLGFACHNKSNVFPPEELMTYMLEEQGKMIFAGREETFASNLPLDELGDEVEAELYVVPLIFQERSSHEFDLEVVFQAWYSGNPDFAAVKSEIDSVRKDWMFKWGTNFNAAKLSRKIGKASQAVVYWSGNELPPRLHEELIAQPIRENFASVFSKSTLYVKTVELSTDDYDFLLVFGK